MKILVIRYRFIGDTILTIPFLRNLRKAYPDAQIDMLVSPVSGDVLLDCPYIDNLIEFDTTRKHRYENKNTERKSFFSYVKLLRQNKYDKAYVLKRSLSSAALAFFAGIKERIGFDTEHRGIFLTKKVPYRMDQHELESFLEVLKADDIPVSDTHLENWISGNALKKINEIFRELNIFHSTKVLIHATSGNRKKQWPPEYFAKLIEYLSNERKMQLFYVGSESDSETYNEIHSMIESDLKVKPLNLCGFLTIQESTALINSMDFVVGCDSGTLHMAASLNIPVIGIYGPMDPVKWKAWGDIHTYIIPELECAPCNLKTKCENDYECLKNTTPEIVIQECERLIKTMNAVAE